MPNILIAGYARHGKDTVAELLEGITGVTYTSSSRAAAEIFLFEELKKKFGYEDIEECFEDRVNHRKLWHDKISDYNTPDKTRLAREIFENNNVYAGMRSEEEFDACAENGIFDMVIWVNASERLPDEPECSCPLRREYVQMSCASNGIPYFEVPNNKGKARLMQKLFDTGVILHVFLLKHRRCK